MIHSSENYSVLITNQMRLAPTQAGRQAGRREGGSVCREEKMNLPVVIREKEGANGVFYPCTLSRDKAPLEYSAECGISFNPYREFQTTE